MESPFHQPRKQTSASWEKSIDIAAQRKSCDCMNYRQIKLIHLTDGAPPRPFLEFLVTMTNRQSAPLSEENLLLHASDEEMISVWKNNEGCHFEKYVGDNLASLYRLSPNEMDALREAMDSIFSSP